MERRRQQRKACIVCRQRKVRCDIAQSQTSSCSVCTKGGLECVVRRDWAAPRRGRQQRATKRRPPQESGNPSSPAPQAEAGAAGSTCTSPASTPERETPKDAPPFQEAESSECLVPQYPPGAPASDGSDQLARTALARFFNDHVDAEWWQVFQTSDNFRIAYIGTNVSNLAHLLGLRHLHRTLGCHYLKSTHGFQESTTVEDPWRPPTFGSTAQSASIDGAPAAPQHINYQESVFPQDDTYIGGSVTEQTLPSYQPPTHYPFPPIRPIKPWKPNAFVSLHPSQDPAQDLCMFPAQEVRYALVMAYFKFIHPLCPIIPMSVFLKPNGELQHQPPLLLYQAVLLAGAHVCTHPLVTKDRLVVKSILFRRASMLFHLRHETARLQLAQAAVLFTWHISDGDTVASGPWYWNGIAMRIALGLGLHRADEHLPVMDRIVNKRLWWSIFIAEAFSALETGRPSSVQLQDFDQSMLREDDFVDEQEIKVSGEEPVDDSDRACQIRHHICMAELAKIILDVLELNAPVAKHKPNMANINSALAVWALRSNIALGAQGDDFYTNHLRIHYNLVVMHLNRKMGGYTATDRRDVCSMAAEAILSSLDRIINRGEIRRCHFSTVGAVTAAGIQLLQDLRAAVASQSFISALSVSERLAQLIVHGDLLAEYWPNASAVTSVFSQLRNDYELHISAGLNQAQLGDVALESPDWNSLFASMDVPAYAGLVDQEWLGATNFTEL